MKKGMMSLIENKMEEMVDVLVTKKRAVSRSYVLKTISRQLKLNLRRKRTKVYLLLVFKVVDCIRGYKEWMKRLEDQEEEVRRYKKKLKDSKEKGGDPDIEKTVLDILKTSDWDVMTEFMARRQASEKLGIDLSGSKTFVRRIVNVFLSETYLERLKKSYEEVKAKERPYILRCYDRVDRFRKAEFRREILGLKTRYRLLSQS